MLRRIRSRGLAVLLIAGSLVGGIASTVFATTTIQTNICSPFTPPSITEPVSGTETEASSIIVSGAGEPAMPVVILDNGTSVGTTMILLDGSYALQVLLTIGSNTLVARETGGCTTEDSSPIAVSRTSKQQPSEPISQPSPPFAPVSPSQSIGALLPAKNSPLPQPPAGEAPATPGFLKPTITEPKNGQHLTSNRVWVTGHAQPGSIVTIYVNGSEVARVVASDGGVYGAMVTLHPGENTLFVRSQLDDKSATSRVVEVQFTRHEANVMAQAWEYFWILPLLTFLLLLLFCWYVYRRHRKGQGV